MRLYHTSDLHNHRGFAPRLQALQARDPGYLIDCGDALRGSQTVYHRHEPILAEMAEAGYALSALGNREFHYLYACMRARFASVQRPVVCANLLDTFGRPLPFQAMHSIPWEGQRRLHFFGLLVVQYPEQSLWERFLGWRFRDPIEVACEIAERIPPGDGLVALSHLGLAADRRLARAVPRLDLILGGHSHDTLLQPEYVGSVPIIHAGPYGKYVSATDLTFDEDAQRLRIAQAQLLPLLPQHAEGE